MKNSGVASLLLLLLLLKSAALAEGQSSYSERNNRNVSRNLQGFGVGGSLETAPPTAAPTIDTVGTVAPKDTWVAWSFTFLYQLWTAEEIPRRLSFGVGGNLENDSSDEINPVAVVQKAYREALRILALDTDAPATIQSLNSTVLQACQNVPNTLPFVEFPECTEVETVVYTLLDEEAFEGRLLRDELREFAPKFNADKELNVDVARIVFLDNVQAELLLRLDGVSTRMNEIQTDYFVEVFATSLTNHSLNAFMYTLTEVNVTDQLSSSSSRRLRSRHIEEDDESYNRVNLLIKAVCSASSNCASDVFQQVLDNNVPAYGPHLLDALVAEAVEPGNYSYFMNITEIAVLDKTEESNVSISTETPPADNNEDDGSGNSDKQGKKKLSIWAILGIVAGSLAACCCIVPFIVICIKVRKASKLKDPEDQIHDMDASQEQFGYGYETDEEDDRFDYNQQLPTRKQHYGGREQDYGDEEDDENDEDSYEGEFSVQAGDFTVADGYSVSSEGQQRLTRTYDEPKRKKKKKKKKKKSKHKHKHRSHY